MTQFLKVVLQDVIQLSRSLFLQPFPMHKPFLQLERQGWQSQDISQADCACGASGAAGSVQVNVNAYFHAQSKTQVYGGELWCICGYPHPFIEPRLMFAAQDILEPAKLPLICELMLRRANSLFVHSISSVGMQTCLNCFTVLT